MIARQAARRQPLPKLWLLTDERQSETLWSALERLPKGSGVVFRHHHATQRKRRRVYEQVRRVARRRRLLLVLSGPPRLAAAWRADGYYGSCRHRSARLLRLFPAHDPAEIVAAQRAGADAVLLSPVFATRSHPGGRALGRTRFGLIARDAQIPVIALGGMNTTRRRGLRALNCQGWAGIDAFAAQTIRT